MLRGTVQSVKLIHCSAEAILRLLNALSSKAWGAIIAPYSHTPRDR